LVPITVREKPAAGVRPTGLARFSSGFIIRAVLATVDALRNSRRVGIYF
jgi:hypothetical protein